MAAIHDLIAQISDPRLRERLAAEWASASREQKFGLVFEDHLPELLPLYAAKPRRGDLVCRRQGPLNEVWQVRKVREGMVCCIKPQDDSHPADPNRVASEPVNFAADELLVVRQFGEPIFPSLVPVDAIENSPRTFGGEGQGEGVMAAPWHTLIEADNYHALQLLAYLYAGQVDCIYIDPPYNTGARDWKYNNDYVDNNDAWRHSKWLAFMEKRLKLAKRLLNPEDSALIVTIDEKEYLRLGLLLEQTFPEANIQMISVVINPKGVPRGGLSRIDEYVFLVQFGSSCIAGDIKDASSGKEVRWRGLTRTGSNAVRNKSPGAFYPIYFNNAGEIVEVGNALPLNQSSDNIVSPEGLIAAWPTPRPNGEDGRWSVVPETLRDLIKRGAVRTGRVIPEAGQFPIFYLTSQQLAAIDSGELEIRGRTSSGVLMIYYRENGGRVSAPRTVWDKANHSASEHGTNLLQQIIPCGKFPFPKSIYAVRDSIRLFVANKPNALIVDFFAGSGTTLNAVNLLNATDGGQRRCILVTNNEVSAEEAETLRGRDLQPGDAEWDALGICRSVTWPRSKFTILGRRDDGTPLPGDYQTGKTVEKEKPRRFTPIGFVEPASLDTPAKKKQVLALIDGLPQSLVQDPCPFVVSADHKASVLFDVNAAEDWLEALDGQDHINDFYLVTPSKKQFDALKAQVCELLGPLRINEDEKRPLSAGFPANLAYFKLDFLDKDRVALKRAFREILPLLWLKAGAVGERPELPKNEADPAWFAPPCNPFAVLLDEGRLSGLLRVLADRSGLTHVFIVTDADESFRAMAAEVREALGKQNLGLQVLQLYRDYLVNFMINQGDTK